MRGAHGRMGAQSHAAVSARIGIKLAIRRAIVRGCMRVHVPAGLSGLTGEAFTQALFLCGALR